MWAWLHSLTAWVRRVLVATFPVAPSPATRLGGIAPQPDPGTEPPSGDAGAPGSQPPPGEGSYARPASHGRDAGHGSVDSQAVSPPATPLRPASPEAGAASLRPGSPEATAAWLRPDSPMPAAARFSRWRGGLPSDAPRPWDSLAVDNEGSSASHRPAGHPDVAAAREDRPAQRREAADTRTRAADRLGAEPERAMPSGKQHTRAGSEVGNGRTQHHAHAEVGEQYAGTRRDPGAFIDTQADRDVPRQGTADRQQTQARQSHADRRDNRPKATAMDRLEHLLSASTPEHRGSHLPAMTAEHSGSHRRAKTSDRGETLPTVAIGRRDGQPAEPAMNGQPARPPSSRPKAHMASMRPEPAPERPGRDWWPALPGESSATGAQTVAAAGNGYRAAPGGAETAADTNWWPQLLDDSELWAAPAIRADERRTARLDREQEGMPWNG